MFQALEELQEQNAKLISLQKENDEGHIKMMNDRIIATQLQVKIKEEMVDFAVFMSVFPLKICYILGTSGIAS